MLNHAGSVPLRALTIRFYPRVNTAFAHDGPKVPGLPLVHRVPVQRIALLTPVHRSTFWDRQCVIISTQNSDRKVWDGTQRSRMELLAVLTRIEHEYGKQAALVTQALASLQFRIEHTRELIELAQVGDEAARCRPRSGRTRRTGPRGR